MHLRLSDEAKADVQGIKDYLEPRSGQGYTRVITSIFAIFDQLETFPFLGRPGAVEDTREMTVPRTEYRIVYTLPDEYYIDVERVLHAKRRYPRDDET